MNKRKFQPSFLHVLSHQLRTPLYSIRDALELLYQPKKLNPDLKKILAIARRKCSQLTKLLEDLLAITDTKIEQIVTKHHKKYLLKSLIEKVIQNSESEAKKKILLYKLNPIMTKN